MARKRSEHFAGCRIEEPHLALSAHRKQFAIWRKPDRGYRRNDRNFRPDIGRGRSGEWWSDFSLRRPLAAGINPCLDHVDLRSRQRVGVRGHLRIDFALQHLNHQASLGVVRQKRLAVLAALQQRAIALHDQPALVRARCRGRRDSSSEELGAMSAV